MFNVILSVIVHNEYITQLFSYSVFFVCFTLKTKLKCKKEKKVFYFVRLSFEA